MIGLVVAALGLVFGLMGSLPPRRRYKGPSVAQLRGQRDAYLQAATRDGKAAMQARAEARSAARSLLRNEWDAMFWEGTHPSRAESFWGNVRRAQGYVTTLTATAARLEPEVAQALRNAAALNAKLAKATRQPRQQAGLVTLVRVCWQGWLVRHRKAVLY